ncbi:hypothetical protein [Actinomycetospora termitidis]|uniref:FAD-binding FR-type domain-containing protein n=1 Tax=Actinomycetospora termitidis TaxID=3053470 RepID=A0ABT7MJN5_9PSEU|nr:hypothetical protein [Actinomycetospora sp. Odt1-22]MDL5160424.1 hypothetical protein [Actinomycetospora sp. Odt1-22]
MALLPARGQRLVLGLVDPRAITPRVGAHLVLAALPLLAITAHVAGVSPMHLTAGLLIVPATILLACLAVFAPTPEDRLITVGLRWGIAATAVYDLVRLDTVALLGWWADFIPTMGTWLLDLDPSQLVLGGVAGYVWRYAGDGGGLGVVFVVLTAATGLRHLGRRLVVTAAVLFAVVPTWGGLIATVALTGRGQQMLFPLTPTTISLSLLGHVVFGLVLGFGIARCPVDLEAHWTRPRLIDLPALDPAAVVPLPVHATAQRVAPDRSPAPAALTAAARPQLAAALTPAAVVPPPAPAELTIELVPIATTSPTGPAAPPGPSLAPSSSSSSVSTGGFGACYPRAAEHPCDVGPTSASALSSPPSVRSTEDLAPPVPAVSMPAPAGSSTLVPLAARPEPASRGLRREWVLAAVGVALVLPLTATWLSGATPRGAKAVLSFAGVAGVGALALAVVTMSRSRRLTRTVGWPGLLGWHRLLGYGALAAVAIHVGVVVAYSPKGLALLNPIGASAPIASGLAAAAALLAAAVMFTRPLARLLPHRTRRGLHVSAAASVAIAAGLHIVWMHVPDTAAGLAWTLVLALAIAAVLIARWWWRPGRAVPMLIHTSRREPGGLVTLRLVPAAGTDHGLRFAPGQFVWLRRTRWPRPAGEHPFTLASSAHEHRYLELTISPAGRFTRRLTALTPGATVYLDGPHGAFTPDTTIAGDRAAGGLVLIAGGSGIAPMLAILRTLADDRDQRRHRLVVSAPGRPYAGELDALAALLDLEVTWLDGRWIDPALLREVLPESGLDQYGFFVCGPDAVITGTLAALDRLDVPAAAIATERY